MYGAFVDGVSDRSPRSLLQRICDQCLEQTSAGAVAVALVSADGHRGTAYASNELAAHVEDAGYVLGEGPSTDAFDASGPVLVADLRVAEFATRWPAFTAEVLRLGVASIFAFPLQLGAVAVGTLALYGTAAGQLDGRELGVTLQAADDAVLALLGAVGDGTRSLDDHATDDGMYRSEVYQASGMLAEQLHITVWDALVRLRAHAFAADQPVDEVARAVVRREMRFVDDNGQGPSDKESGHD